MMRAAARLAPLLFLLAATGAALADEPRGCDKFAWNIDAEQKLLNAAGKQPAEGTLARDLSAALTLKLAPFKDAKLVMQPERAPKDPASFAGKIEFAAAARPGSYAITLSAGAWIDVIQGGHYLKPTAFTGALECPGVRKSVKFDIGAESFTVQLSSVSSDVISVAITPAN